MTSTALAATAGALLSLLFSYLPGLSAWYDRLGERPDPGNRGGMTADGGTHKRLVMLALLGLSAGLCYGVACAGWGDLLQALGAQVRCDRAGLLELLQALVVAIMANQSVYQISPRTRREDGHGE
jgi:hypothetical protein